MKLQTPHLLAFLATITLASFPLFAFAQVDVITEGLRSVLWFLVVQVFGTILGLAGVLFDYGINEFVINFGTQFSQNGIGVAVDTVWVVIRDFINMTFIFGLVYIGMKMILNSDDSNTRKWLANLIIAALLINFSLFFTKFIVDISNQFATTIASQGFQKKDGGNEVEVSIALLDKLGVATIFNSKLDTSGTRTPGLGYIFGTALILIITTFVFAAGGILLIIRFAMLNLFMIFSPVMFLSFILPSLQSISSDYWRKFLGKAFFAPLYILFIYISFRILDSMKGSGAIQDGDLAGAFNTSGSAALSASQNTFPFFILASILLIGSLVIANKLGAEGAGKAISLGKSLSQKAQRGATKAAGGVAFGAPAKLAQGTVGLGASRLAESSSLKRWAAKSKTGQLALRATRRTADSSFDARRVGGLGKATGLGEGKKGGYTTREKAAAKRAKEFADSLEQDVDTSRNEEIIASTKEKGKEELETIKAMQENENKSTLELTKEMLVLDTGISLLTEVLEKRVARGNITEEQRNEDEAKIKAAQEEKRLKQIAKDEVIKKTQLQSAITRTGIQATSASNPEEAAALLAEKSRMQLELAAITNLQARKEAATNTINSAKESLEDAQNKERNAFKEQYVRRLANEAESGMDPITGKYTFSTPFAAARLEAVKKATGGNRVLPDSELMKEVLKNLPKNPSLSPEQMSKSLKEAFNEALEKNRELTMKDMRKQRAKKSETDAIIKGLSEKLKDDDYKKEKDKEKPSDT